MLYLKNYYGAMIIKKVSRVHKKVVISGWNKQMKMIQDIMTMYIKNIL